MPIYEYHCKSCGKRTSVFLRSITTVPDPTCEHCGGRSLDRLISRVAVLHSSQDLYRDYDRMSWMDDLPDDDDDGGDGDLDGGGSDHLMDMF